MPKDEKSKKVSVIKYIYLYLVTVITIVMMIISTIGLIRIVLKEYVFDVKSPGELEDPKNYWECNDDTLFYVYNLNGKRVAKDAGKSKGEMEKEREECRQKIKEMRKLQAENELKSELIWWLSMLIVAFPLYLLHWGIIRKEAKIRK